MKKFFILCFCVICLAIYPLKSFNLYEIFNYITSAQVNFYVHKTLVSDKNYEVINHGAGAIVSCSILNGDHVDNFLGDKYGESISFVGNQSDFFDSLNILNAEVVFNEVVSDELILYGFSNLLGKGVLVDGKTVNFQMVFYNNIITIGTPLIFGSF